MKDLSFQTLFDNMINLILKLSEGWVSCTLYLLYVIDNTYSVVGYVKQITARLFLRLFHYLPQESA